MVFIENCLLKLEPNKISKIKYKILNLYILFKNCVITQFYIFLKVKKLMKHSKRKKYIYLYINLKLKSILI